ncbi:4-(cytidine 5'-diphospho)-2-C-methyl-D-erythritol kinase [soil metagenome]
MSGGKLVGDALAPAKINLGLEIAGRRIDGYHDVTTVMQTVSLFDRVRMITPGHGNVVTHQATIDPQENLVTRAVRLMATAFGRPLEAGFQVHKRIPIAAGLGGGSSDAATAIRMLAAYWQVAMDDPRLTAIASDTGSDVAFFLSGGRAIVEGRGERIRVLPPLDALWVVIIVPDVVIARKTATLYGALRDDDFSDGSGVRSQTHSAVAPGGWLPNAFMRPLAEMLPGVQQLRSALDLPGVIAYGLSGAGPAHFMLVRDLESAARIVWKLRAIEALQGHAVRIARTMTGTGPLIVTKNPSVS